LFENWDIYVNDSEETVQIPIGNIRVEGSVVARDVRGYDTITKASKFIPAERIRAFHMVGKGSNARV
jgi:hypothetical protein